MNLTVEKDALVRALGRIHRIVERKNTIPILSNVLLSGGDGAMTLRATDLDVEATDTLPAEVTTAGTTSVSAYLLHDIVRKLPESGQVTLALDPDGGRVTLRSGRSRFVLPCLPAGDFPTIDSGGFTTSFTLQRAEFRALFERVQAAISTEETRYYLNGIYMHIATDEAGETVLRGVATDGHRLGMATMPAPAGSAGMPGVIVPRKAVTESLRLADDSIEVVEIDLSPSKIRLRIGGVVLTSKLIDGTFPDYERVIPKGNDRMLDIERAPFISAIDRVSTVSNERGRAVSLSLVENTATLLVNNPDSGSATEELGVGYEAAPLTIGFNHRYLIDALGVFEDDSVVMALGDAGSPAIIRSPSTTSLLYVLMPMRV